MLGCIKLQINHLSEEKKIYEWQKEHLPNLTGTAFAVKPRGSLLDKGLRQKSAADYEAWIPKK